MDSNSDTSVSTLVNSAITDAQTLVRQQIELAKAEVTQSAKQAAGASGLLIGAAVLGVPGVRVRAGRRRLRDRRCRAAGVGRLPDRRPASCCWSRSSSGWWASRAPSTSRPRSGPSAGWRRPRPPCPGSPPRPSPAPPWPPPRTAQSPSPRRDPPRPRGGRPGRGTLDAPRRAGERLPVPRRRDGRGSPGPAAARLPDVLVDLAPRPAGARRGRLPRRGHGPARLRRLRPSPARLRPVHPLRRRQRRDPLPGVARRRRRGSWLGRVPGLDGRRHAPGGDPRRSCRCRCRTRAGCGPPCWATPDSAAPRPTPSASRCRPPPSATCSRTAPPRSDDLCAPGRPPRPGPTTTRRRPTARPCCCSTPRTAHWSTTGGRCAPCRGPTASGTPSG